MCFFCLHCNQHCRSVPAAADVAGGRHRDRNTRQPWPGGLLVPARLLSAVRHAAAQHDDRVARRRRRDPVQQCAARHQVQLLAVLHERHARQSAGVDGVDNDRAGSAVESVGGGAQRQNGGDLVESAHAGQLQCVQAAGKRTANGALKNNVLQLIIVLQIVWFWHIL